MSTIRSRYQVRNTISEDFLDMIRLTEKVYPFSLPYDLDQLGSQQAVFPDGQFVVREKKTQTLVGFASSLIINWDDYDHRAHWWDITGGGMFTNHDASGKTLYGAEVMVDPDTRGQGVGKLLYQAREDLVRRLTLTRIRAGARLRDYHKSAARMSAAEYVKRVIRGTYRDRTLSFQLKWGFHVLCIVDSYLPGDPESLGYAAIIEWLNPDVATKEDYAIRDKSEFAHVEQHKLFADANAKGKKEA